jgi:putative membrane protein
MLPGMTLLRFLVLVGAFALMPKLIPGIRSRGPVTAFIAAILFAVLNFLLGWLLKALLVVGTLGLAFIALNFLVNMVLLWLTDKLLPDFEAKGFGALALGSGIITVLNAVAHGVLR